MSKAIWKFLLLYEGVQSVSMPEGAEILTVQVQAGTPCMWALVEQDKPAVARVIRLYCTGYPVDQPGRYIGTFQLHEGAVVFHAFEVSSTEGADK